MLFNVLSFFSGGSAPLLSNRFGLSDPDGEAKMITWQHVGETLSVGPCTNTFLPWTQQLPPLPHAPNKTHTYQFSTAFSLSQVIMLFKY